MRWKINKSGSLYGIRGDTARIAMTRRTGGKTGPLVDMTGCTVKAEVRTGPNAYEIFEFTTDNSDLPNGLIVLEASEEVTGAIKKTEGFWDLQVTWPDGAVETLIGPAAPVVIAKDITL